MRTKIEIKYPSGYPYILYEIKNESARKFVVSATDSRAIQLAKLKKPNIKPANIHSLISELGHEQTSKFLASFNPRWCCKEGKIFYKNV